MNPNRPTGEQSDAANAAQQVLTFCLGTESYAVDILLVQEIRGWTPVTRLPQAPPHLLGMLNLRGSIVPVIDLRLRFGLEQAAFTPVTVIVVLSVQMASGRREFGLVVDSVSDVVDVEADDLKETPSLGSKSSTELIKGIAAVADRMLILLNVEELIHRDLEQPTMPALAGAA
ncbi:MAG TPA: chemotaxis protein CheW [Steroidobacteraceae bacterium]|nr:chemotaxis protein CheW [Steroidobacteraceae bacterium]